MFDPTSRYYHLPDGTMTAPDGREITYKRRRFLPRSESLPTLVHVTVNQGDRLDQITARTIRSPEQYWRVADANDAMNPPDLPKPIGRRLRIPIPQFEVSR